MIKFVKDGRVVFTENDKGDLMFVDKDLERSFMEKSDTVPEDTESSFTTEDALNKLKEAFASPAASPEQKTWIKVAYEKTLKKAKTEGLDTTNFTLE